MILCPHNVTCPANRGTQACQRVGQFALTVALDARKTDDFAGANFQRDAGNCLQPAVIQHFQFVYCKHYLCPRRGGFFADQEANRAPSLLYLPSCLPGQCHSRYFESSTFTMRPRRSTATRSLIAKTSRSLCEMKMIEWPCALRCEELRRGPQFPAA